ncbi:MAG: BTAD domain-containing putative transcriptional regulator [Acidimicrobiales bacterium]
MVRPFRFTAPALRSTALVRPRLLRILHGRWEHRVAVVIGGAGLGKTTLLVQAMVENQLAPHGKDVWLALDHSDADGGLGDDLLRALDRRVPLGGATAAAVAEAVWSRSPLPVCLLLDDCHLLPAGSSGHGLLVELVGLLPANGHLVIATRTDPQLPLARLATTGELQRVTASQLRFDQAELDELAERHGLEPAELVTSGGWPAMAELTASAGRGMAGDYLWQEVIEPLGRDRRRILAALVDLGGGDDALISAALDQAVSLSRALDGVPLVAVDDAGWHQPHALWRPMARLRLADAERPTVLRRAVRHHIDSGRFGEAFALLAAAGLWDEAPGLLRASCLLVTRHPPADLLRRWVASCPDEVVAGPWGQLALGVLAELERPDQAVGPLQAAIAGFREDGDLDAELGAITHLGRAAWWTRDFEVLASLHRRISELKSTGHPVAAGLAAVSRAVFADLNGDDAAILDAFAKHVPGQLGPAWDPMVDWLRAAAHYGLGDPTAALAITGRLLAEVDDQIFRVTVDALNGSARWRLGLGFDELDDMGARLDDMAATGVLHNVTLGAADLSRAFSHVGDVEQARTYLDRVGSQEHDDRLVAAVRVGLAEASLLLAEGDEEGASRVLRAAVERFGLDRSSARRAWRDTLGFTYILLPETRPAWSETALTGCWAHSRELAAAVVALREGDERAAVSVDVTDLDAVRARLHHRFAAELAVGLDRVGRAAGADLLDRLGQPGRSVLRTLAASGPARRASGAKTLLAAVPAPPQVTVEIGVLGPMVLRRDGQLIDDPALRRERVRALLAYLISRRTVTRAEIVATLWPDLDDRAGSNNLRVTTNHLLRALEPWRGDGEPAYFLRSQGQQLRLVSDPMLRVDVDEFDRHLTDADAAERDGVPSIALDAYLAAIRLWRGGLHSDGPDVEWLDLDRERVSVRHRGAVQRAAQLVLGRGDLDHAEELAGQAIELDPWAEPAHGVLVAAALARGDRTAARRALDRSLAATADLGVEPSDETRRLARRCGGAA